MADSTEIKEYKRKQNPKSKKGFILIIILIVALASIYFYNRSITYVSTDDAYIDGDIVQIAPKVSGNIVRVYVDDNQNVKEGEILAEIDSKDYQNQCNQAEAKLESAVAKQKGAVVNVGLTSITSDAVSEQSKAALKQANNNVSAARAEMNYAQIEIERYSKLYSKGIVSKQDFDKVSTSYKVATEKLNAALKMQEQAYEKAKGANTVKEQIAISDSQLKGVNAEIKQLKAGFDQAKLNLSYTKIYAPQAGYIINKNIEKGSYVTTGQSLLAIVPEKRWITANFKETQLTNIKVGQLVNIKIDTYPGKVFKGRVDSIQAASGSKSSLFPPENAVGSFVKVVQRIPVKIVFTEQISPQYVIVPGMSVVPEVKVK